MQLQEVGQQWSARGIHAVGIVGQRPEPVQRLRTKRGIAFPILIDADRSVIKRYGVYHLIGVDALNIARPAVFVIDTQGVVRWQHVGRHQADRPSIAQIEDALADAVPAEQSR